MDQSRFSWQVIGAFRAGVEHYRNVGYREYPLSGEWAGESIPELSALYGVDLANSELADCFEEGFSIAQAN